MTDNDCPNKHAQKMFLSTTVQTNPRPHVMWAGASLDRRWQEYFLFTRKCLREYGTICLHAWYFS